MLNGKFSLIFSFQIADVFMKLWAIFLLLNWFMKHENQKFNIVVWCDDYATFPVFFWIADGLIMSNIMLEKSKWKNAWLMNKLIFLSFWTILFDAVSDTAFENYFVFRALKQVCDSSDKYPNQNIWISTISHFEMSYFSVKYVRAEKGDNENWSMLH